MTGIRGAVRSEWIKLWSVRSTWWCLAIAAGLMLGLSLLVAGVSPATSDDTGADTGGLDAAAVLSYATVGVGFGQLVFGVLGCLVVTGEYGTGMIRTTLLASPWRARAMLAKGAVLAVVALLVSALTLTASTLVVVGVSQARGITVDLDDGQLWRGLAGACGYLALVGLLSTGIGLIVRVSAGAIATALGVLLVLPIVATLIAALTSAQWLADAASFLPSDAGAQLYGYDYGVGTTTGVDLSWWAGGLVLAAWAVAAWIAGLLLVRRRDV
ncbi:MAG: ABC transporter permease [Microbacteriaceae bacterium]